MKNLTTKSELSSYAKKIILMTVILLAVLIAIRLVTQRYQESQTATITVHYVDHDGLTSILPTQEFRVEVGSNIKLISPSVYGFATSWPVIELDKVLCDEEFVVHYYSLEDYDHDLITEKAGGRAISVLFMDIENGAHLTPPINMALRIGETFCIKSPTLFGYEADFKEVSDTIGTDHSPEEEITYIVFYDRKP